MNKEKSLTVVEQKEVEFYGDDVIAVRAEDERVYVSVRHICEALGIDVQAQTRRIERHTILSAGVRWVAVLTTQLRDGEEYQQTRRTRVLRVDLVPLWLSGIRSKSVREEIRPKLERFQQEAADVLWEAFKEGRLSADDTFDELTKANTPEAKAYHMAKAIYDMARQQLILSNRIEIQGTAIELNSQRIESIEARLGDSTRFIDTVEQVSISQAVKTIALELGRRSGRNEFGGVWGEVYRQFQVTSYLQLPSQRFDEVMNFLRQWWESLTDGGEIPF